MQVPLHRLQVIQRHLILKNNTYDYGTLDCKYLSGSSLPLINNTNTSLPHQPAKGICLVVGVGPGIGGAVARKFAKEGFNIGVTRRRKELVEKDVIQIKEASPRKDIKVFGYTFDARDPAQVKALFDSVVHDCSFGDKIQNAPDVVIFNIGANVPCSITEETPRKFRKIWEMSCFAGFHVGQEAAKRMLSNGKQGTIIFTGATASLRGKSNFAAFSSAKGALRNMTQAMAHELQPKNIHVCHVIIDGIVNTPPTLALFGLENIPKDEIIDPNDVADTYWYLHNQKKSAWTHEMDLRPFKEKW